MQVSGSAFRVWLKIKLCSPFLKKGFFFYSGVGMGGGCLGEGGGDVSFCDTAIVYFIVAAAAVSKRCM